MELEELIVQATEHLRYMREIGVTEIGEAAAPALASAAQEVVAAEAVEAAPPATIVEPDMPKTPEPPSLFEAPAQLVESGTPGKIETLEEIRAELGDCRRCKLWSTRTNLVFGEGNPTAELMFVGEGPGADEDASGRPFIGRAGQLLTKMIEAIEFKREEVYIANVVKSRPPGNRAPEPDEVKACSPFLYRQIAAVRPKLIVTLGNPATQALLQTRVGITQLRGRLQEYPRDAAIKVIPTFHPAYLLRSPDKKREAWEDLKKVRAFLLG